MDAYPSDRPRGFRARTLRRRANLARWRKIVRALSSDWMRSGVMRC